MARFCLSLGSSYGDTLRRTPQAHLRPLSTLTDRFADTDVAFGSDSDVIAAPIVVRSAPRNGHREFGAQGPKVPCSEIAPLSTILARKAVPRAPPERW